MPLLTQGFISPTELRRHARIHGPEFNAKDATDYLVRADNFLGSPLRSTTEECMRRSDHAIIRWDTVTDEYGVLSANDFIITYFIQDRAWHPHMTNRAYFQDDCRS